MPRRSWYTSYTTRFNQVFAGRRNPPAERMIAMGYKTKVQLIKRKESEQWYVNFPAQLAQAMEFKKGETVEWFIEDKSTLAMKRQEAPEPVLKK